MTHFSKILTNFDLKAQISTFKNQNFELGRSLTLKF